MRLGNGGALAFGADAGRGVVFNGGVGGKSRKSHAGRLAPPAKRQAPNTKRQILDAGCQALRQIGLRAWAWRVAGIKGQH